MLTCGVSTTGELLAEVNRLSEGTGGGGTTCASVQALKQLVDVNGNEITLSEGVTLPVRTRGYYAESDAGGDLYYCRTLAAERAARGEAEWEPDGYASFYLGGGEQFVAVKEMGSAILIETVGVSDTVADNLPIFHAAFEHGLPLRTALQRKTFDLSDTIRLDDKTFDLDLGGNTLNAVGTNERCFLAINYLTDISPVSDVTFETGRTKFTVPIGHNIGPGDKIKAYSNQVINPYSQFDRQRCAEYFAVESVTATTIVCIGRHIWDYSQDDNPRIARVNTDNTARLVNVKVGRSIPHNGDFAVAVDVQGYYRPQIEHLHAAYFPGQLLSVRSCYRARMEDISADELLDDTSSNAVGYVGVDYGSQESEWYGLNGGKVRHTYTTGADSVSADIEDPRRYGGAVRCHVYSGVTVGATNFAYDTHQDAWECEFHDITVYDDYSTTYASSGAFQDRSQNNIIHKLTHISDGADATAGETTVLFNTGARNTLIKQLIKKGNSSLVSSFGLAESFTDKEQGFRIEHVTLYLEKYATNVARLAEPINLSIGTVEVLPWANERTFYGNGGGAFFRLSHAKANLSVDAFNLRFDSAHLPALTPAGDSVVKIEGAAGRVSVNVNTYTNANTYERFEGQLSGLRGNEEVGMSTIKHCLINWTAHVSGFTDEMSKDGKIYDGDEVQGLGGDIDLKYTYKVLGDGVRQPDSSMNATRTIFNAGMVLDAFNRNAFGLVSSAGVQIDQHKVITVTANSSNSSIGNITAPVAHGQTMELTNLPLAIGGISQDLVIDAGATNTNLETGRLLRIGESITLTAYDKGEGEIVWHVPPLFEQVITYTEENTALVEIDGHQVITYTGSV